MEVNKLSHRFPFFFTGFWIKNRMLLLSILEGLYIIYMFVFFKTRYTLEIGRWEGVSWMKIPLLIHPTERCDVAQSQICQFGKIGSILIFIYLVTRHIVSSLRKINRYVFIIIFILCLMNMNAVVYMLPVFIIEVINDKFFSAAKN